MHLLRIAARDAAEADRISDLLMSLPEPDTSAAAALEIDDRWRVDAYYEEDPGEAAIERLRELIGGRNRLIELVELAPRDWVRDSLEAMPPVSAGRFVVHGRHDRHRVPANAIGIEIEANLAFGTGHHGTTRGCLIMLDRLLRRERPKHVLDVGTGTGVLAIAAARATGRPVTASDIDPVAVAIARENALTNRAGALVRPVTASGFGHRAIREAGPYDLILANILAGPLMAMAPDISRSLRPGGRAILSGLLTWQGRRVLAACVAQGLRLEDRVALDGWLTLMVRR
ncbi:MAG: 50S ribosomal protein L11 methyltransferase [Flavobacteriaceae bacterium]